MSTTIIPASSASFPQVNGVPALPWRDPHSVSPEELAGQIELLERACVDNPKSADLRILLGMAHAMNYDVYKSFDALEAARQVAPEHFWAQLKFAELHYRIRTLECAEDETVKAVELARNPWELSLARKQLQEIRRLRHQGTRDVTWNKPLLRPVLGLVAMLLVIFGVMLWK